jgi:hypothetical protein
LIEIAEKAHEIGVEAVHLARTGDQRIDRADGSGQRIDTVAERKDRFLERNGDIAADKLAGSEAIEQGGQARGFHIDGLVAAVDAVGLEPKPMNERRAGMSDRVADDESAFHVNPSKTSGACRRSAARSGRSGSPNMVK